MTNDNKRTNSTAGSHLSWIYGIAVAGLVLFFGVALLLVQRLGAPILTTPQRSTTSPLGGLARAPSRNRLPNNRTSLVRNPIPTQARRPVSNTVNQNWPSTAAEPSSKQVTSKAQPGMPTPNSVTKPAQSQSAPLLPESTPFAKLPRDSRDSRLAVLALPDPKEDSQPVVWDLSLTNGSDFEVTLVGSEVLLSKKLAEIEIVREQNCESSGEMTWCLQCKDNLDASVDQLGQFRLSVGNDSSQLTFAWLPDGVKRLEAELVRWLAVGLSVGQEQILCRLSQVQPIPRLTCKFDDDNAFRSAPSFHLRSKLLIDRLNVSGSGLLIDVSLPTDLRTNPTFDSAILRRCPFNSKSVFTVPLAVISEAPVESQLELFRKDEPLALLTLKPAVVGDSFTLEVTATANLPIYDRAQVAKFRKSALERGDFIGPTAIASGLTIAEATALDGAAAAQISTSIRDTINKLERDSIRRDGAIEQAKKKIDAASRLEEDLFVKTLDSLAKRQGVLTQTIKSFKLELQRHDARSVGMLRSLLFGDGTVGAEDKSIRGIINRGTIGVTIGYECQFNGATYFMIIEEASE